MDKRAMSPNGTLSGSSAGAWLFENGKIFIHDDLLVSSSWKIQSKQTGKVYNATPAKEQLEKGCVIKTAIETLGGEHSTFHAFLDFVSSKEFDDYIKETIKKEFPKMTKMFYKDAHLQIRGRLLLLCG